MSEPEFGTAEYFADELHDLLGLLPGDRESVLRDVAAAALEWANGLALLHEIFGAGETAESRLEAVRDAIRAKAAEIEGGK